MLRSEVVSVNVAGRSGHVCRPNLVGALVVKAAAQVNSGDRDSRRHRRDFLALAGLISAADFKDVRLTKTDRRRLASIIGSIMVDRELLLEIPGSTTAIDRLKVAAQLEG